jgi:sulfotransferase family protein
VVGFFAGQARKAIALQASRKPGAVAFVEKVGGPLLADFAANVCAGVREIVLLREFWDVALSMIAFDAKRGTSGFFHAAGRDEADAWLVDLAARLAGLRQRARRHGLIALSYEELMRDPHAQVRALMDRLAIDTDAAALDAMVKAIEPGAETRAHTTTEEKRAIRRDEIFSPGAMAEVDRALAA